MTNHPAVSRRVLHVQKRYRPVFTGEGVFLERSSAVMQEIAGTVTHELLVTHTPRPAAPVAFCSTLARVAYLNDGPRGAVAQQMALCWWFLRNLHRYDAVHFRCHADWYFLTYAMTKLAGRRLVLSATLDDSLPVAIGQYRPALRGLAARGFALFDAYIGISPKLHAQNLSVARDPARCHLLPCGITVPLLPGARAAQRAALGIDDAALVLLFVGGLCARKDPLFLITALPSLLARQPDARLLLVGPALEPDYVAQLHATVAALGLGAAVIFAGEQADPHPSFAAADILVFASRLEGFGTVVPEAMGHGLPVVVRRLPGVNDSFVLEGETGFAFVDEAGFLAALLPLAADARLRARIGATGRALVARDFDMQAIAARTLCIYGMGDAIALPPACRPATGLGCAASAIDPRFHSPGPAPSAQPLLLTMIDAEEAFDWNAPFSRDARDVAAMAEQHRAHRIFERHGVVPLYLADYPVAVQDRGAAPLRELHMSGLCDIGAHMHPWVTPPFEEAVNEANSFAGHLPAPLEYEKLRLLTEALAEAFGSAPRIYRAGRFGAGPRTADVLLRLGYLADSSISACWPTPALREEAGIWLGSAAPYWLDRDRTLLEIPVSARVVGRLAGRPARLLAPTLYRPGRARSLLAGAAARLGLLERIRLTPEGMTLAEAQRLVRAMLAQGQRSFVLTYHAPSLLPGNTPYVRNIAERDRFLAWLDAFYGFFREEIGGRSATWRELRFGVAR